MKTKLISSVSLLIAVLFVGCESDEDCSGLQDSDISSVTEVYTQTQVNVPLEYGIDINTEYEYSVSKEPYNGTGSEVLCVETLPEQFVYCYTPKKDFIGMDYAEILVTHKSDALGLSSSDTKNIMRIKIDVKKEVTPTDVSEINVKLKDYKVSYSYFINWDFFPRDFEITTPATHASRCEIVTMNEYPFETFLVYVPKTGFKGNDFVELKALMAECGTTSVTSAGSVSQAYRFNIKVE